MDTSLHVAGTPSKDTRPESQLTNFTTTSNGSSVTISRLLDENKLLRHEVTTISTDFKNVSEQLHALKIENRNLYNDKVTAEKGFKSKSSKTIEIIRKEQNKNSNLNVRLDELQTDNRGYKQKLQKLVHTKTEIQNLQLKLQHSLAESQVKIDDLSEQLGAEKNHNLDLTNALASFKAEKLESSTNIAALTEELADLKNSKAALENFSKDQKATIDSQSNDINLLQNEVSEVTNKYQSINYELDLQKTRIVELETMLDKSKQGGQKLHSEIYQARAETAAVSHRENLLKKEIANLKDQINQLNFKTTNDKMNLISDLPALKMKKNETEFECVKRGFLTHYNNCKKLTVFKKDIIEKIRELPEGGDTVVKADIDSYKLLAQAKLELSRLRVSKKDNLQSIKLLEKRNISLTTTVEKQDNIIKKLEKSSGVIDKKYQDGEAVRSQLALENSDHKNSINSLRTNIVHLKDELDKEKIKSLHSQQTNDDYHNKISQLREDFDVYLHGLWHKILTCDILSIDQLDKISKLNDELVDLTDHANANANNSATIVDGSQVTKNLLQVTFQNTSLQSESEMTVTPERVEAQRQMVLEKNLLKSSQHLLRNQIKLGLGDIITKSQLLENKLIEGNRQIEELNRKNTSSKKQHGKNLNKIESHLKQQESTFSETTKKLELKYGNLIKELQLKNKSSEQQIAQLEKAYGAASTDLAKAQNQLNFQLIQTKDLDGLKNALNVALSLTLGSLVGVISNNSILLNERVILSKQLRNSEQAHQHLIRLKAAFRPGNSTKAELVSSEAQATAENSKKLSSIHLILKFRKAAIVVIAANRLRKLLEIFKKSGNRKVSSNPLDNSRAMTVFTLADPASTNSDLTKIVEAIFNNEARNTMLKSQEKENNLKSNTGQSALNLSDAKNLDALIRNFMKLLAQSSLKAKREKASQIPVSSNNKPKSLLNYENNGSHHKVLHVRLNLGLFTLIKSKNIEREVKAVTSLTFAAGDVQRSILNMSEQVYSSELEMAQLRKTELSLREEIIKQRHKTGLPGE